MSKTEFIKQFEQRCRKMTDRIDVAAAWLFMDQALEVQGWLGDQGLILRLCEIETNWQAKKRIITHFEDSNLWLAAGE